MSLAWESKTVLDYEREARAAREASVQLALKEFDQDVINAAAAAEREKDGLYMQMYCRFWGGAWRITADLMGDADDYGN